MSYAFFLTLASAVFVRLFFGVNFADEAYYVALPYTFALGNRPIVNELFITQLAGVLVEPAVVAFLKTFGSTDGLVLFVRVLFFLYSLLCCALAVLVFRARVGVALAVLATGIIVTFVPACVPSLGYNTLGYLGFACGSLAVARGSLGSRPQLHFLAAGLFHSSAALAYPPLAAPAALSIASGLFWLRPRLDRSQLTATVAAAVVLPLLSAAIPVALALEAGPHHVARMMAYVRSFEYGASWGGWAKAVHILAGLGAQWAYIGSLFIVVVALWLISRAPRSLGWLALVAIPPLCVRLFGEPGSGGTYPPFRMVLALGLLPFLLLPLLAYGRGTSPRELGLEIALWLWSLCAGALAAWASGNGIRNAQLGLLPGALVGVVCLLRLERPRPGAGASLAARRAPLFICLVASLELVQLGNVFAYVYRDGPMASLTARVADGPFMGLYTTPERREFLGMLRDDLKAVESRNSSIAFLDDFPAGFLFTTLKPEVPTVWIIGNWPGVRYDRALLAQYYSMSETLPDVVVHVSATPADGGRGGRRVRPWPRDALLELFQPPAYGIIVSRPPYYAIYERVRGPTAGPVP